MNWIPDSTKNKLYAVNIMLQHINELPIETLEDFDSVLEAQVASTILEEVKRNVLSEGWDFNTDEAWDLVPDVSNTIGLPATVLDITASTAGVVMRDYKLYDKQNQTYEFDESQTCEVVWDMDFNTLPHPIREYIVVKASRIFQVRSIGDKDSYGFTQSEELEAKVNARRSEGRTGQYSMTTGLANELDNTSL